MKKRWLSWLLVLAMALSLFPVGVLAADEDAAEPEEAAIVMEEEAPAAEEAEPAEEPAEEEEPAAEPAEEEEPAAEPEAAEEAPAEEGAFEAAGDFGAEFTAEANDDDRDPAVVNVENLIAAIGWPITAQSESKIKAARAAYNKLSASQKDEVTNYADLLEAEARLYDVIRATEFIYEGTAVKFINIGGAEFDAYKPQGNTLAYLYDGKIVIEYYPKDKTTYAGFYLGADIRYPDHWSDDDIIPVGADSDGNLFFELPAAKAGYAWPVAPVTSSMETTAAQYYLAIPGTARLEANYVVRLIMAIGTVTSSSGPAIEAAREAYEDLTEEQKAMVYNYDGLQAAEEEYYALVHYAEFAYAGNEITFIDISYNVLRQYAPQGGTLAYLDGDTIHVEYYPSNKTAFTGFYFGDFEFPEHWTDFVQADVNGNLFFPLAADKAGFAWPVAPVKADGTTTDKQYYLAVPSTDQLKANYVVMLIDAIGNVTPDSIAVVQAARAAYDALTTAQQALVDNYADLLDAEEALYDLLCVPEFAYEGTEVKFIESDGVTAFSLWLPQTGTAIYLDGDTIYVDYVPRYVTTYDAFYTGDIRYPDFWTDYVGVNSSGVLSFTLKKDYAGKAWPVAPVEKAHPDKTTPVQYYLAIPNTDVLKANKVIYMIDAIGDVDASSKPAVKAAREAYDALTDAQKLYVDNYEVLYLAEEYLFEILHVIEWPYTGDVVLFIDEYGNQLSQYEPQDGSIAYLSDDDTINVEFYPRNKQTFTGFKFGDIEYPRHWEGYIPANDKGDLVFTLDKDYAEYAWPVAPVRSDDTSTAVQYYLAIPGEDQLIANNVVRMIWAIGTVTAESEAAVKAAREAYDALTAAQKALIDPDDYKILTKAEEALYDLVRAKEFKFTGDGVRFIDAAGEDLSTFAPLEGSIAYLYVKDGLIHVEYIPKNPAYIGFYLGADIRFDSHWSDADIIAISANYPDGTYSFTLDADKAGYAWPVVLEKLSGPETDKQHYLAIPVRSTLEINCAIYLIDQIGEVDATKKEIIQEARAAYDLLTSAQKAKVTNYSKLTDAEEALTALLGAYEFIYTGAEISFIRLNGEPFTMYGPEEGTFAYYDGGQIVLSYYPKDKETYKGFYFGDISKPTEWTSYNPADTNGNYVEIKLDTGLAGYAWPVAIIKGDGKTTTLQYYFAIPGDPVLQANTVIHMIDSIGPVTAASQQTAIEAARAAYDALGDEEKRLVENYKVLEAAEYALYQIIGAKEMPFVGPDVVFIDESNNFFMPYLPEAGTIAYIENGKIVIEYYPKDKDTYDGFYFGDIRYPKYWEDFVAASKKGNLFLTLGTEMAGKALPVAPVIITENSDGTTTETTTSVQYYLAVPNADQLKANYVARLIDAIGTVEATEESAALIEAASDAFNELTPTQQALVSNAADLAAAEAAYAAMPHTPRLVLAPGDALLMLVDEGKAEVDSLDQFGNPTSDPALIASWVVKVDSSQVTGKTTLPFDVKYHAAGADGKSVDLAGKISYSTNDKKVVTVSAKADGTAKATITAKANGAATITATATIGGQKVEGSMAVYVREYTPRLQSKSITVNSWKSDGVTVPLRPGYENDITSVSISSTKFTAAYSAGELTIKTVGEQKNGTTKNVPLTVKTTDGSKEYTFKLNITVKNAKPAVTVKQTQKYNTFYTDSEAAFSLTAPANISSATFETATYKGTYSAGVMTVTKKASAPAKTAAKGTLTVVVDGYTRPFTKTISVAAVNTKPDLKLSGTSFTINTAYGEKSVKFSFVGTLPTGAPTITVSPATAASCTYSGGEFTMTSLANKKATATISVQESNWVKPMTFKVTLKVNSKLPTAKLAKGTLLLNAEYPGQTDSTLVKLNTTDVKLSNGAITLTPKGDASAINEAQKLIVKYQNGEITARFGTSVPRAGTYSFTMKPKLESGKELKEITVKVKVSNNTAITAAVSASGKLDALKRDSTAITYTVTALDSITGKITGVKVTGTDALLFDAELVSAPTKGIAQAKLTLKKDAVVSTKTGYQIALSFTVEGLPAKAVTKTLTVKVAQSSLKLSSTPKTATLFQGQDVTKPAEYLLKVTSPEGVDIHKIAVSSKTPLALRKSLVNKANVTWVPQGDGTYLVKVTVKDPSKVVNGKSYNLTLDVIPEGCATDVHPTITVVVKVMK